MIYLDTPSSRKDVTASVNVKRIQELSKSKNPRIKNLAIVFLKDLCNIDTKNEQNPRKFATAIRKTSSSKNCDTNTTATASTSSAP